MGLLHRIRALMTARLDTIHASPAWRSTGLPTSLIGAAGRKARDAGATHQCTCRHVDMGQLAEQKASFESLIALQLHAQQFRCTSVVCTCRSDQTLNMLRDLPIFQRAQKRWVAAFL